MIKLVLATAGVTLIAVLAAAFGSAQPVGTTGTTHATHATALPPLPAAVKSRNRWIIGVKCDVPPFGHIDATTSGSVYDRWMKNCYPTTSVITADTFTNAKLAFDQGRADAVMYDDAVLLPVAAADPNSKISDDTFLAAPFGIGIRKGDTEMKAWVDSRLEQMRKKDQFLPILKANVPARFLASFSKNILRPNQTFQYAAPGSPSVDTVCQ